MRSRSSIGRIRTTTPSARNSSRLPHGCCPITRNFRSTRCTNSTTRRCPGLTHRYVDKALFLPTNVCPVYCRYCTRSYAIGGDTESVGEGGACDQSAALAAGVRIHRVASGTARHRGLGRRRLSAAGQEPQKDRRRVCWTFPTYGSIRIASKGPAIMPSKILTDTAWTDALISLVERGRTLGQRRHAAHAL